LLYFEHPIALSIIIISARGSTSRKEAILTLIAVQAIIIQKRSAIVKALDFYYRDRSKLDSFLISIDIYILFN
jgi:predicted nucleic-acid-binding protein